MKTKEELNTLKNEVEALKAKLADLNEEELMQVTGGSTPNSWGNNWGEKEEGKGISLS